MFDYIMVWTLGEIAVALGIVAALGVAALVSMVPTWYGQMTSAMESEDTQSVTEHHE